MKKFDFGVGVSSYQIEGAPSSCNKVPSIWDTFSHIEGNIKNNDNGDIAIDFYNRYKDDLSFISDLGVDSFRFSISWGRVVNPDGTPNQKGLDFYKNVVKEIKKNGMKPVVTLYHWDLPQYIQDEGGWLNPKIVELFENYTKIVVSAFKHEVMEYITINEPPCIIELGNMIGVHAPGLHLPQEDILRITHNVLLAHAKSYHAVKELNKNAICSIVCNNYVPIPVSKKYEKLAYDMYFDVIEDHFVNTSIYLDPIFLGDYPAKYYEVYKNKLDFVSREDMKLIKGTSDVCYQNIYSGYYVGPFGKVRTSLTKKGDLSWLIVMSESLYYGPKFLFERYKKPVIISENGFSTKDLLKDGKVNDSKRIKYIDRYFHALMRCKDEGVDVRGYYYWSIFDNFEWAEGYNSRFGLIYVDYESQRRYKKNSYYFYKDLISTYNGK